MNSAHTTTEIETMNTYEINSFYGDREDTTMTQVDANGFIDAAEKFAALDGADKCEIFNIICLRHARA